MKQKNVPRMCQKCFQGLPNLLHQKQWKNLENASLLHPQKKTMWAGCIFDQWQCIRNYKAKHSGDLDKCIEGNLFTMEIPTLCEVLSNFMEIRKQNSDEYPRETLYEIILSLQHYMSINGWNIKLLDHPNLGLFRNILDNWMKQLSKHSVVRERQQAKPITIEEENAMWELGVLGDDTPEKLFNTLLYLISLYFALHACDKHKSLKTGTFGQLKVKVDPDSGKKFLEYTEHQSKAY